MLNKVIGILIAVTLLAAPAFAEDKATPEQLFKQRVAAAKTNIRHIDLATLANWIKDDKDFILVDVREANEVTAVKIEAEEYMAIPRGVIEVKLPRKIKELDTTLVLYCLKGSRGALSAKALSDLGYTNVYNLDGGILAWIQKGYTVSNMFGSFEMKNYVSNYK